MRSSNRESNLRWGVEKRLEFIEFRLYFEGRMNRGDLMKIFGVSVNQASTDLNRYLKLAPENMVYDKSARSYLRSDSFMPLFLKLDASTYLNQLRALSDGIVTKPESWAMEYPVFDAAPAPTRVVDPTILQTVLETLREELALEIRYQSLSAPMPEWRWIAPHAIGFDGFRWHIRAFCDRDRLYKDFLLARVIGTRGTRRPDNDPDTDRDWHEHVALDIGPHPGLSASQKEVIALDYGMEDGRVTLRVRRAFL
ncbi:MAG: WYL domain-containing protein, partial [Acidobacteriia bacterium]|nr:WYL domain-containing protein [Terriglobia bacterium]